MEGRCYRGVIFIGQRFTRSHPPEPLAGGETRLHLIVEAIVIYGRNVDQIEEGLTAEIQFFGDPPNQLAEGWVLSTE